MCKDTRKAQYSLTLRGLFLACMHPPILIAHLFPVLDSKLLVLLKGLPEVDWEKPTVAPLWRVKDIVAHLLDGNLRTLSMLRDGYFGEKAESINSYQELVTFLNKLNADWVSAFKRVSPQVLITLLETTGKEFSECIATLAPFDKAIFSVAWAGEDVSQNWFHIAREYTEKWIHQQQIRLAVGLAEELYEKTLYAPYLEVSMRALPHHYRALKAPEGTILKVHITGKAGGDWFLVMRHDVWTLSSEAHTDLACTIEIEAEVAWRIFTKGISRQDAEKKVCIWGDKLIGEHIFSMLAVMA